MFDKVEDFLMDDTYVNYVLDAEPKAVSLWKKMLSLHPEIIEIETEARSIILAPFEVFTDLTEEENIRIKTNIMRDIRAFA